MRFGTHRLGLPQVVSVRETCAVAGGGGLRDGATIARRRLLLVLLGRRRCRYIDLLDKTPSSPLVLKMDPVLLMGPSRTCCCWCICQPLLLFML